MGLELSPSGRLIAECREHVREYMKSHPEPISGADLIKVLNRQAEARGWPMSSLACGDTHPGFMTRWEGYSAAIWSLRAHGELLVQNGTWKDCWHEHVPTEKRGSWLHGDYL